MSCHEQLPNNTIITKTIEDLQFEIKEAVVVDNIAHVLDNTF